MQRRSFLTLLGGTAAAWPMAARAQQPERMPVIGYLSGRSAEAEAPMLAGFRKGLAETGYVEGRNVAIDFRFAKGQLDQLGALATDLASRRPAVVVAVGGSTTAEHARAADPNVPIVFSAGGDPVQLGLVTSFNRPGGNVTGVFSFLSQLAPKNLGLLRQLDPKATNVAILTSWSNPADYAPQEREISDAAATLGMKLREFNVVTAIELDAAYAALLQDRPDGLLVMTNPFLISRARQIVQFVRQLGVPAIYNRRDYSEAGGLLSYGDNIADSYRFVGIYAGRILKGEKPGDLPVFQANKLEFIINLKTAKEMNIAIPPTLSALADEVIE